MRKKIKLHPGFSCIYRKYFRSNNVKFQDGYLVGDTQGIETIEGIISKMYGTKFEKEEFFSNFDFSSVPESVFIIKVGVCYFEENPFYGWDGSINAVWFDNNPPGEVIEVYFRYYMNRSSDISDVEEIIKSSCSKEDKVSRLIDVKLMLEGDERRRIDRLVKKVLSDV